MVHRLLRHANGGRPVVRPVRLFSVTSGTPETALVPEMPVPRLILPKLSAATSCGRSTNKRNHLGSILLYTTHRMQFAPKAAPAAVAGA